MSLEHQLHESEKEFAERSCEKTAQAQETDELFWDEQQEGKLYGYLGPLSIDDIGFRISESHCSQMPTGVLDKLHAGTHVIAIHKKATKKQFIKVSSDDMFLQVGNVKGFGHALHRVMEMRRGQKTRAFERHKIIKGMYAGQADRSMSIAFDGRTVVNWVFDSVEECDTWWCGLSHLVQESKRADLVFFFLKKMFNEFHQQALDIKLVKKLLKNLQYRPQYDGLLQMFMDADTNSDGVLEFDEFLHLIQKLQARPELEQLFMTYTGGQPCMTADQLRAFLHHEQNETHWSLEKCQAFIMRQERGLDLATFEKMINSPWNMLFSAKHHNNIYQDMTRSLADYYIASSHNTYLERSQIYGFSATEMYVRTLKLGVKCIELDTWNGKDGTPDIYHGHTLVARIKFMDVLEAIRDYAFIKSRYPLILSIENHCNIAQQIVMARQFVSVLGDMLAIPSHYDFSNGHLPSPTDLMGKILLKGKAMDSAPLSSGDEGNQHQDPATNVAKELSDLIFLKIMPLSSLGPNAATFTPACEMLNFSENNCKKIADERPYELLAFAKRHLARVYSKGTRLLSSNYTPSLAWSVGCQIVAYNVQTPGMARYVHEGMFADNGGCGYVLKPPGLMPDLGPGLLATEQLPTNELIYTPLPTSSAPGSTISKLIVEVLSARNLPYPKDRQILIPSLQYKPKVNPFIEVQLHGTPSDTKFLRTKSVSGNAINPTWNESFVFDITASQIAVLVIKAGSYRKQLKYDHIGHFSVRLENLRSGYRVVPLMNHHGFQSAVANVFCKFTILP